MPSKEYVLVKLTLSDAPLVMRVEGCQKVPTGQYPEVEWWGRDPKGPCAYRMPEVSAQRQLDRLGLSMTACVGETLSFSRAPNLNQPTKPYHNVELATPAEAKPKPESKRIPPPDSGVRLPGEDDIPLPPEPPEVQRATRAPTPRSPEHHERDEDIHTDYIDRVVRVLRDLEGAFRAAEVPLSSETVQAVTFSITRHLWDKGLLP